MRFRLHRLALPLLILTPLAPVGARAGDTEPGTYWEQTVEMQMGGMKMPAQSQKVCMPKKGIDQPPSPGGKEDKSCEMYDVQRDGPKMTWKIKCTGKNAMTGEGEMVTGKDGYTGQMAMHMDQGDMTMKLRGKLVGGDCDAAAIKKQVAAIQKQAKQQQEDGDRQMDEMCEKAADEMSLRMFSGPVVTCKKPEQVGKLCAKMTTRAGYSAYHRQARQDPEAARIAKQVCKKDPDDALPKLCTQAAKETSGDTTPDEVLAFLGDNCPEEARAVAKKACAGRKFTGLPDGMRRVCVKYAKNELGKGKTQAASDEDTGEDGGDEAPPPKKDSKDKAMDAGKKLLKGLW
jgi:hypothetical protein